MTKRNLLVGFWIISTSLMFQNCSGTFETGETGDDQTGLEMAADLPVSFFAIHFEPRSATNSTFEYLKDLIADADQYRIKLTLQFTPSWAKLILNDPVKIEHLRKWQENGHEVAAHHHGAHHGLDADGYTNLTSKEFYEARYEVYEAATASARALQNTAKSNELAEIFQGSMADFVDLLEKLAGDQKLKLMTMPGSTDLELDWPETFSFSIDNIKYSGSGSSETFEILEGALATPTYTTHRGFTVLEMEMQYLSDDDAVAIAKKDHSSATSNQIIGVVTHIEDYQSNPSYVLTWMKYLKSEDEDGSKNKTVSEILNGWN